MNIIETLKIETADLNNTFMPHQIAWIEGEDPFHEAGRQVVALAEKSVRIGFTYADAFKNVRKRLFFPKRDYLFATKDYPSALEYMRMCKEIVRMFNLGHSVVSHGEENFRLPKTDASGRASAFTEDVKVGVIKFDNGSRIIAFSANPQAMAVYGGDVGLDEFAKHPNARLLWETAQGRVTWGYDLALWSSHDGEDTLFNEFAQEARATAFRSAPVPGAATSIATTTSDCNSPVICPTGTAAAETAALRNPQRNSTPWNLYFRVTIEDAIKNGLVDIINKSRGTKFTPDQFLADCRARARDEEIFQQAYMCNPLGAAANHIVEWSAIERCRYDYDIDRLHLEAAEIQERFGAYNAANPLDRERNIKKFLDEHFASSVLHRPALPNLRLGFDVAASGNGDLAVIYIDEKKSDAAWLRALFTCRTEDWHFLKTTLFHFMDTNRTIYAAGDETGLGRQICWEAAKKFGGRFKSINFAAKKHDLGFALMNQISVAERRFPRSEHDIAADYFALKKMFNGNKWNFSEGKNALNAASHCDIAWAGALAAEASQKKASFGISVLNEDGTVSSWSSEDPAPEPTPYPGWY